MSFNAIVRMRIKRIECGVEWELGMVYIGRLVGVDWLSFRMGGSMTWTLISFLYMCPSGLMTWTNFFMFC